MTHQNPQEHIERIKDTLRHAVQSSQDLPAEVSDTISDKVSELSDKVSREERQAFTTALFASVIVAAVTIVVEIAVAHWTIKSAVKAALREHQDVSAADTAGEDDAGPGDRA